MQGWISLKQSLIAAAGIEPDALRILTSLLVLTIAAGLTRRSFSHALPWLIVLLAAGLNEAASLSGMTAGDIGARLAARDVGLAMVLPTALFLLARFWPNLLSAHQDRRIFVPAIWDKKAPVVDTVIKKIDERRAGRHGSV